MNDFLEFSNRDHAYYKNGRLIPSVTQILEGAGKVSPYCKDEVARERGRLVHELTAADDLKRLDLRKVPKHIKPYILSWRQYRKDSGFVPAAIEERIDCGDHGGYCGTFDRVGTRPNNGGLPVVIDLKTGAIPDYARLQTIAYAHAYDSGSIFERIAVSLKLSYTNPPYTIKVYPTSDFYNDRAEWLAMVSNYHQQQKENNGTGHTDTAAESCGDRGRGISPA